MAPWLKTLLIIIIAFPAALLLGLLVFRTVVMYDEKSYDSLRVSNDEERNYLLHVPAGYAPDRAVPLVISLHGFSDWPAHHSRMTGWSELADEQGFIVVYPSGTGYPKRWRMPAFEGYPEGTLKDVQFLSELIDHLQAEYNLDPARIYVDGMSNGGGMAFALGCKLSGRIAAVGGVAGYYVYPLAECQPSRRFPMILYHGTGDPIVSYTGHTSRRNGFTSPALPDFVASLSAANGCSPQPVELPAPDGVTGRWYQAGADKADVQFYTIDNGGHTWPGGRPLPRWLTGSTFKDLSATRLTWKFFQSHPLLPIK